MRARHITLISGKALKPFKQYVDLRSMEGILPPPVQVLSRDLDLPPEVSQRAGLARRGAKETYFFSLQNQVNENAFV